ncbi:prepilin-type N-terminal cleavage/methylation domain-containing protein [Rhodanobacter fulvus Jip2]|jgi:type IV fimbrial biogenesis protein FimT|uniref:Type II secretion system protein H n=1 Tax=Rhodanobacter fulvus Jip2 TaxID=1163408 RepID=I4VMD9_9GAMM|nr:GspH/FimT family pseudopilin [Rhodanobacter fulvus]EIL88380.1 prepilin-type N-terminal cleavage/methylation domain-containing protein [Rhodanobacter fulvus Jip2]
MSIELGTQIHQRSHRAGFSLIELMVAITVLAILAAIALPNFRSMIRRNGVSTQVNAMYSDLQYARSEAITTRSFVSLCPRSTTAVAGEKACGGASNQFDRGWLAYASSTSGADYDTGKPQSLLQLRESAPNVSVRSSANGVLTLNSRGEVVGGVSREFMVCAKATAGTGAGESTRSVPGKRVVITASGRVSAADIAVAGSCG